MGIISDKEIAQHAANAFFGSNASLKTMVAVALGESGGSTTIRTWCCTGVWQIHKVHAGGPKDSPKDTEAFRRWLENPANNARAARWVYDRQGLGAWDAYTNGSYRKHLTRAGTAVEGVEPQSHSSGLGDIPGNVGAAAGDFVDDPLGFVGGALDPGQAIANLAGTFQAFGDVIGNFISFVTDPITWKRIVLTIGGVTVAVVGINIVAKPVTEPALKVARTVATKGK